MGKDLGAINAEVDRHKSDLQKCATGSKLKECVDRDGSMDGIKK